MKNYVLTVTLNPAIDKTVTVPNFSVGRDFREDAIFVCAGGKGLNVSRVLKCLRINNIATGFRGGPCGDHISQMLNEEGVRHDFCKVAGNTRTSLTVIDPSLNTITRVLERGPQITRKELKAFRKKFLSLLKHCRCVIFSGRNIPGAPDFFYADLITAAKRKKIITVLDSSGRPYELGLEKRPFMVKPNLAEVEQVEGKHILSVQKVKQAAFDFYRLGIQIVAVTMGSRGAVVFDGKEMVLAKPPRVKRRSPVGCGDAFIGGFIASRIRNESFVESVRMAVACGAANALSMNPGFIRPSAVREILKKVKIKKIKI